MKKILATLLLGLSLTVAALPAAAETSGSAVTMTATAQGASVKLELPAESVQGVKAMRLSFAVESTDPVEADFAFDSALPGSVQQYRYDAATGRMNVYVAGGQELFPDGTASLGSIRVEAPAGSTATVRLVEDSLELVNGAFGRTAAPSVAPASVEVTVAEDTPAPAPTPDPTQPPAEQPGQQSGTAQSTQSASNAVPTATAAPEATAVPAGNGQTTVTSGGSGTAQKPAKGSGGSSAAPQVTPNPTEAPQSTVTPAPSEAPSATPAPATPEQAETAAAPAMNLPLVGIIAVACLAVAVLIGIAVLRFRSR